MVTTSKSKFDYSKYNIVICPQIEKDIFISYIMEQYPSYNFISYKLNTITKNLNVIEDKRKLKYKNTVIFSNVNYINKGFSNKSIAKFKTPVFCFVNNYSLNHIQDSIVSVKMFGGNIIVSPHYVMVQNESQLGFLKYSKNYLKKLTNDFTRWIVNNGSSNQYIIVNSNLSNIFKKKLKNKDVFKNFKNIMSENNFFLDMKDKITEEELVEYFIENPIIYKQVEEIPIFF